VKFANLECGASPGFRGGFGQLPSRRRVERVRGVLAGPYDIISMRNSHHKEMCTSEQATYSSVHVFRCPKVDQDRYDLFVTILRCHDKRGLIVGIRREKVHWRSTHQELANLLRISLLSGRVQAAPKGGQLFKVRIASPEGCWMPVWPSVAPAPITRDLRQYPCSWRHVIFQHNR